MTASTWLATWRDTSIAIVSVAGALITLAAACRLPIVRRPAAWLWRALTRDITNAYWGRHRVLSTEAAEAVVSPAMAAIHEDLGRVHQRVDDHAAALADISARMADIESRVDAEFARLASWPYGSDGTK